MQLFNLIRSAIILIVMSSTITQNNCQSPSPNWVLKTTDYPNNYILCSTLGNNGTIWFGTEFGKVTSVINGVIKVFDFWEGGEIISLDIDSNNNLWIGAGCPLYRFDGTSISEYFPPDSNCVFTRGITVDNEGNIWVASISYGIYKYSDSNWINFNSNNSNLPGDGVSSITHDSKNNIWGKSGKNLVYFIEDNWESFSEYYPCPWAQSIAVDANDIIWFGTWDGKLIRFDVFSWDVIQPPEGVDYLGAIAIDSNNNKWCGFDGGFAKYDGQAWELFTVDNSPLPSEWVTTIVIDEDNNKWIGTYGGGIAVYNENGVVTSIEHNSSNLSAKLGLSYNYPNPFNPSTTIKYSIPKQSNVILRVFDVLGGEVITLVNKEQSQGNYEVEFDGSELTSGIYFYRLSAGDHLQTKKMILLK